MTASAGPPEQLGDAEKRLISLLADLNHEPPPGPETDRVLRSVRWERAVRIIADALGGFGLTIADAFQLRPPHPRSEDKR
jgi:hypothetical protein